MLRRAGYALSDNEPFDIIMRYGIEKCYDRFYLNDLLNDHGVEVLGAVHDRKQPSHLSGKQKIGFQNLTLDMLLKKESENEDAAVQFEIGYRYNLGKAWYRVMKTQPNGMNRRRKKIIVTHK